MNVSVVIATCGDLEWADLAWSRAYPSARAQDAKIVIEHYPGLSVPDARNTAARGATGDWLCFLDADDELAPGYLDAMAAAAKECALLVPAVEYVHLPAHDGATGFATAPAIPNRGGWPKVNECVIGTLIERDLFSCLGGFRELASIEDYDLFLRAYDDGAGLVYVEDAVYRAYVSPTGGRNLDQGAYAEIWAEHLARIAA